MQQLIDSPKELKVMFAELFYPCLKIWKKVTLGANREKWKMSHQDLEKYCGAKLRYDHSNFWHGSSETEIEVNLVLVTPAQIGLESVSLEGLYERAEELGLSICSDEVVLELRKAYSDQLDQEVVSIGVRLRRTRYLQVGDVNVWYLSQGRINNLGMTNDSQPRVNPDDKWVFERKW